MLGQCPNFKMAERDCVRRTSRSAAADLRHSRAAKSGHYRYLSEVALRDSWCILVAGSSVASPHRMTLVQHSIQPPKSLQPMKIAAPIILITLTTAFSQGNILAAHEVREEFHQTYPLKDGAAISLDNVNGNVLVNTWDSNEIKVDAVKRADNKEHLDQVTIEVDAQRDHIRIHSKYPESKFFRKRNNSTKIDYTVTVPRLSRLDGIKNVNGGVEIQNFPGDLQASSVNGSVKATGLGGKVNLSSVNGGVKASFTGFNKSASLHSVNGSVTVELPPDSNAEISAKTVNGGISGEFAGTTKKHFPIGQNLNATIGHGGAKLDISTVNGGIRIERAKAVALEKK